MKTITISGGPYDGRTFDTEEKLRRHMMMNWENTRCHHTQSETDETLYVFVDSQPLPKRS